MEPHLYQQMLAAEVDHWWFRGRRHIVESVLRSLDLPSTATILDLGCGTGGNLAMLARFGSLSACETSARARELAETRRVVRVVHGALPDDLPYAAAQFDVVVMLDVLEHVKEDSASLVSAARLLKTGGHLLLTVPALPWLWTSRDEAHHHYRRYTRRGLHDVLLAAGLEIRLTSYYNTWLFPPIAANRLWQRWRARPHVDDLALPPGWLNRTLAAILSSEAMFVRRGAGPVGVSLLALARKHVPR